MRHLGTQAFAPLVADWSHAPDGPIPAAQTGQVWTVTGTAAVHSGAVTTGILGTSVLSTDSRALPVLVTAVGGPVVFGGLQELDIWFVDANNSCDLVLDSIGNCALVDSIAGVGTTLAQVVVAAPQAGDVHQLVINGQVLTYRRNGITILSGTSVRPPSSGVRLAVNTCGWQSIQVLGLASYP